MPDPFSDEKHNVANIILRWNTDALNACRFLNDRSKWKWFDPDDDDTQGKAKFRYLTFLLVNWIELYCPNLKPQPLKDVFWGVAAWLNPAQPLEEIFWEQSEWRVTEDRNPWLRPAHHHLLMANVKAIALLKAAEPEILRGLKQTDSALAAGAEAVDRRNPKPGKRGLASNAKPKEDKRMFDAWETARYKTYANLGGEMHVEADEVRRAIDRHRKRLGNGKSPAE